MCVCVCVCGGGGGDAIIFRMAMAAAEDADKLQALNYICRLEDDLDNGLGSTLKNWLRRYAWKDQDGKGIDAGIDLRNEMCPWYSFFRGQNCSKQCRQWHICKRFFEGDCNANVAVRTTSLTRITGKKTEKLGLDRF